MSTHTTPNPLIRNIVFFLNRINFYLARNGLCYMQGLWVQCMGMYSSHLTSRGPNAEMIGKTTFRASHHVNAITILLIGVIITTSILFVFTLVLNQNQTAIAQQQGLKVMQNNQTSSPLTNQQLLNGNSFKIDNMTFSHRTASVNAIQLHYYVIGGHGNPVVLLHGWPETWYEWRHVMPALSKNYTVIAPDLRGLGDFKTTNWL